MKSLSVLALTVLASVQELAMARTTSGPQAATTANVDPTTQERSYK